MQDKGPFIASCFYLPTFYFVTECVMNAFLIKKMNCYICFVGKINIQNIFCQFNICHLEQATLSCFSTVRNNDCPLCDLRYTSLMYPVSYSHWCRKLITFPTNSKWNLLVFTRNLTIWLLWVCVMCPLQSCLIVAWCPWICRSAGTCNTCRSDSIHMCLFIPILTC